MQLPQHARRNGRCEANGDGRDATAKILEPQTDEQLEMDLRVAEPPKGTRRDSVPDAMTAGVGGANDSAMWNAGRGTRDVVAGITTGATSTKEKSIEHNYDGSFRITREISG
jgi:hypothetical protein